MAKSAKNDKKLTKIKKTKSVARNRPSLEHSSKVKDSFARAILKSDFLGWCDFQENRLTTLSLILKVTNVY